MEAHANKVYFATGGAAVKMLDSRSGIQDSDPYIRREWWANNNQLAEREDYVERVI